ncbi:MAG: flagellar export protein FliJ [Phycisphaerae bacterium]
MPRAFRFRLEVVRTIRRQELDAQRRAVANLLRTIGRLRSGADELKQELHRSMHEARVAQLGGQLDVDALQAHLSRRGRVRRRILQADEELALKQAELDIERKKLADAHKRLKVIDKLHDTRKLKYDTTLRRWEQAECDEAALQMHSRREYTGNCIARGSIRCESRT